MNNMLEYKGYHAKIEFDKEDMLLTGEVFGIRDSLNFHASSVEEIEEVFHQSIDNYLEFCAEIGKTPDREFKGSFNVRIDQDLHREAAFDADREGMTLNQYVENAIRAAVNKTEGRTTYIIQPILRPAAYKKFVTGEVIENITNYISTKKTY